MKKYRISYLTFPCRYSLHVFARGEYTQTDREHGVGASKLNGNQLN